MGGRRYAAHRSRRPHDRECTTVLRARFHSGRPPRHRRAGAGEIAVDGWSNVVVSRNGRYIEATGSLNGEAKWPSTRERVAFRSPTTTMMIKPRTPPRPERTRG